MEPYSEPTVISFPLLFQRIRHFAAVVTTSRKTNFDYQAFAQEYNQTADGKRRFYVTTEILDEYAKSWEKVANIRTTQEMVSEGLKAVRQTKEAFAAPTFSSPDYLTGKATFTQPTNGVYEFIDSELVPDSLTLTSSVSTAVPLVDPGRSTTST
ncbi:hypothetical protein C8J56DRAFT_888828 [Mycena floridula]|nr:hypothetical protein C8J56DRAFT_888828 [Mycena floridula]